MINTLELTIVKYLSMVFQGVSRNLAPIATIVISYFWTKERFKPVDIIFTIVSLLGVTAITYGFSMQDKSNNDS